MAITASEPNRSSMARAVTVENPGTAAVPRAVDQALLEQAVPDRARLGGARVAEPACDLARTVRPFAEVGHRSHVALLEPGGSLEPDMEEVGVENAENELVGTLDRGEVDHVILAGEPGVLAVLLQEVPIAAAQAQDALERVVLYHRQPVIGTTAKNGEDSDNPALSRPEARFRRLPGLAAHGAVDQRRVRRGCAPGAPRRARRRGPDRRRGSHGPAPEQPNRPTRASCRSRAAPRLQAR